MKKYILLFIYFILINGNLISNNKIHKKHIIWKQINNTSDFYKSDKKISKIVKISAGELIDSLNSIEKTTLTDLKIKGTMDARDFVIIRDYMASIKNIDLSEVKITAYSGDFGTYLIPKVEDLFFESVYDTNRGVEKKDNRYTNSNKEEIQYYYLENTIPIYAFYRTNINSIVLSNSIEDIDDNAFCSCSNLSKINFPDNLKRIGNHSFSNCNSFPKNLILPSNIDTIDNRAFYRTQITKLTIPSSLKYIGDEAFFISPQGTDDYTCIYLKKNEPFNYGTAPFVIENYVRCTLFVPKGTKKKYKEYWNQFVNISEF